MDTKTQIKEAFEFFRLKNAIADAFSDFDLKFNPNHEPAGTSVGGQFAPLTESQRAINAVSAFHGTDYEAINNELRFDKPDIYADVIAELDKISNDLTDDTLFRGFDADFTKQLANKYGVTDLRDIVQLQKLVGKTVTDKGFMSTSKLLDIAADFARDKGKGVTMVMQLSGKKRGIDVAKYLTNLRAKREREFILKRGSSFTIKRVSLSKTKKIIIYADTL